MRKRVALVLVVTLLGACKPAVETSNIFVFVAPGGRHSAKLDLIIGGPPMGGAVVWQELRIVSSKSEGHPGQSDATLVLSSTREDSPCVSVQWLSPATLLVYTQRDSKITRVNSTVDGVRVLYEEASLPN